MREHMRRHPVYKLTGLRSATDTSPAKRFGVAGLATILGAALLATAASAVAQTSAEPYSDLNEASVHSDAVADLDSRGILAGTDCAESSFCPNADLKRWVMGVWLVRAVDGEDPPETSTSVFADVDADEWWSSYLSRLRDLEITNGCSTDPLKYCPDMSVTRAEMATFLQRAFDLKDAESAGFDDTAGNFHESAIDALAAAGVTRGCSTDPLLFCPSDTVTRAEAASFVSRSLQLAAPSGPTAPAPATAQPTYQPPAASAAPPQPSGSQQPSGNQGGQTNILCPHEPNPYPDSNDERPQCTWNNLRHLHMSAYNSTNSRYVLTMRGKLPCGSAFSGRTPYQIGATIITDGTGNVWKDIKQYYTVYQAIYEKYTKKGIVFVCAASVVDVSFTVYVNSEQQVNGAQTVTINGTAWTCSPSSNCSKAG